MPSEAETTEATEAVTDEAREALLQALTSELGDALVGSHHLPGKDLWIRVGTDAWSDTAAYLRNRQQFRFFSWLSAIDWMPSPYGRSLDAAVDVQLGTAESAEDDEPAEQRSGYTGGDTRFQVIARVHSLTTNLGLTVKADVPGTGENDLSVGTWTHEYPGAAWHERETWEMFGIVFEGHPGLRHIYLPGDFEGHPLRKDYPLLARIVKPWPGIVDVEPMPEVASTSNPEDAATAGSEPEASGPGETNPEGAR